MALDNNHVTKLGELKQLIDGLWSKVTTAISNAVSGLLSKSEAAETYATKVEIPTVPTNVSAFENDAGYITEAEVPQYELTKEKIAAVGELSNNTSGNAATATTADTLKNGLRYYKSLYEISESLTESSSVADVLLEMELNSILFLAVGASTFTHDSWGPVKGNIGTLIIEKRNGTRTRFYFSYTNNGATFDGSYDGSIGIVWSTLVKKNPIATAGNTWSNPNVGSESSPIYVNTFGVVNKCGFGVKFVSTLPAYASMEDGVIYIL